jgi:hypothetical protein
MYKYLLFEFEAHESAGGMDDLVLKFNTYDDFINNYKFKDVDFKQLVDTSDFSFKEFYTNISHHWNIDDYKITKKAREEEFANWIFAQINN